MRNPPVESANGLTQAVFRHISDFRALRAPIKAFIKSLAPMELMLSHRVVQALFAPCFLAGSTYRVHDEMRGMSLYRPVAAWCPLVCGPSKLSYLDFK